MLQPSCQAINFLDMCYNPMAQLEAAHDNEHPYVAICQTEPVLDPEMLALQALVPIPLK